MRYFSVLPSLADIKDGQKSKKYLQRWLVGMQGNGFTCLSSAF